MQTMKFNLVCVLGVRILWHSQLRTDSRSNRPHLPYTCWASISYGTVQKGENAFAVECSKCFCSRIRMGISTLCVRCACALNAVFCLSAPHTKRAWALWIALTLSTERRSAHILTHPSSVVCFSVAQVLYITITRCCTCTWWPCVARIKCFENAFWLPMASFATSTAELWLPFMLHTKRRINHSQFHTVRQKIMMIGIWHCLPALSPLPCHVNNAHKHKHKTIPESRGRKPSVCASIIRYCFGSRKTINYHLHFARKSQAIPT